MVNNEKRPVGFRIVGEQPVAWTLRPPPPPQPRGDDGTDAEARAIAEGIFHHSSGRHSRASADTIDASSVAPYVVQACDLHHVETSGPLTSGERWRQKS